MTKDYYKILGITELESAENIKSAYRKLARKWHPDIAGNTPEAIRHFKEINEAYEILSNKIKKMSTTAHAGSTTMQKKVLKPVTHKIRIQKSMMTNAGSILPGKIFFPKENVKPLIETIQPHSLNAAKTFIQTLKFLYLKL